MLKIKIAVIAFAVLAQGCVTKRMAAEIGASGFFAGRINARQEVQEFIAGENALPEWQNSALNYKLSTGNYEDDMRLLLLSGQSYDQWIAKYKKAVSEKK